MKQASNSSNCIGIVGLGLIGGSLALDLQATGSIVHGLTSRSITAEKARERKLANFISTDPKILSECDLVIIALPLMQLISPPKELINALPINAVVTDVGSVKAPVLKKWKDLHPRFVASHPMAGTEESGVDAGRKGLFRGRPWISTPDKNTDKQALEIVHNLANELGAQWIISEAELHDKAVALISHLPVIISAALLRTLHYENHELVLALAQKLASSGFADTTRVGGGNPQLGRSLMENNTNSILSAIASFQENLEALEKLVQEKNWNNLENELETTKNTRSDFLK